MPYVAAHLDPRFQQSLPVPADALTLLTPLPARAMCLLYRDDATGDEYLVPNVWYNQSREVQRQQAAFVVERAREQHRKALSERQARPLKGYIELYDAKQRLDRAEAALARLTSPA